jgi:hypothetical protein
MKKIMFNDKYGLTAAVLNGKKTMTRRIIKAPRRTIEGKEVCGFAINKTSDGVPYEVWLTGPDEESLCQLLPTYKVGEIVAVAQNYESMANGGYLDRMTVPADNAVGFEFKLEYCGGGYKNKMFVASDLMPHHIRITDIKAERLQDISEEDVYKEGFTHEFVNNNWGNSAYHEETMLVYYDNKGLTKQIRSREPKEAFSFLIDKVSGNGTWERNPWVFVYTFELID